MIHKGALNKAADKIYDIWAATKTQRKRATGVLRYRCSTGGAARPAWRPGILGYDELIREAGRARCPSRRNRHGLRSQEQERPRAQLFEKINDGRLRILMGSSQKLGVGVNVQDKLIALHHLDIPHRPADLEQREGRIIRQGNENPRSPNLLLLHPALAR